MKPADGRKGAINADERTRRNLDSRYGCSMHAYRGDRVCTNNLLISRMDLGEQLLAGLQAKVLHPHVVAYTFTRFAEQLAQSIDSRNDETREGKRGS